MGHLKQAEQNVINIAKEMSDVLQIIEALNHFGNVIFSYNVQNDMTSDFFNGLSLMRKAIYERYIRAIADCFYFVSLGGEEAIEFSRKLFKERFDKENQTEIMSFLDKWGNIPSSWSAQTEEKFREEASSIIRNSPKEK